MKEKKTIFFTGASGFIGKRIITDLTQEFNFVVLSRYANESKNLSIKFIQNDLTSLDAKNKIFEKIDYIIHAAGDKKNESKMYETNVLGTKKIVEIVNNFKHIKLIHISSGGVLGLYNHKENCIDESAICYPNNLYEKTKLEAENEILSITEKNRYVVLRPTNVFGENDPSNKLLNLIKTIKAKRFFYINKKAKLNYVYVGQISFVIKEILAKDIFLNEVYFINSSCTIEQFVDRIQQKLQYNFQVKSLSMLVVLPLWILAKLLDFAPNKFQKINTSKLKEMTSEKFYSTAKVNRLIPIKEDEFLSKGISALVDYYFGKKLL